MINSEDIHDPVYGVVGICGVVGNLVSRMLIDKKVRVIGTDMSPANNCKFLYTLKDYNFPKFLEDHPESFFSQVDIIIPPPSLNSDSDLFKKISEHKIDVLTVDDCLTRFKPDKPVLCITGTNGKTTTTTLLKHICRTVEMEPTEHGLINFQGNIDYIPPLQARLNGDVAILETGTFGYTGDLEIMMKRCEPECGVITNINPDHLDETHNFRDYASIKGEFVDYMKKKKLIINSDDPTVFGLVKNVDHVIKFGVDTDTDDVGYKECWCGKQIKINETIAGSGYYECECGLKHPEPDYLAFEIEESIGRFKLKTPDSIVNVNMKLIGLHNVYNVTGAIVAAREYLNIPMDKILTAVETFEGVPGRIEHLFTHDGMEVILDYGHNPAGIETVLRELKKVYDTITVVLTVSSESGEQGDVEIFDKVLKFGDFIVPASHASRIVAETKIEGIKSGKIVLTNESKSEFDKTGTLGASSDQVVDGIKAGLKCQSAALICLGEAAFKFKKFILELE
jgi:UDP-N-acetylmuramate--alanine ligase